MRALIPNGGGGRWAAMSPALRLLLINLLALVLFVVVVIASHMISKFCFVFLFVGAWGLNRLALTVKCPRCKTPVVSKKIWGLAYSAPWASSVCSECGFNLRGRQMDSSVD